MKNYTITIYLKNGEKTHSPSMTKEEVKNIVSKLKAKKEVYMVYNHETNEEENF